MPTETPKTGRIRHCWNCGESLGFVADRFYGRTDTCGKRECEREARNAFEDERQAAHDAVDDYYGGGW